MHEGASMVSLAADISQEPTVWCLSAIKVQHDLDCFENRTIPQNLRQAMKMSNFKTYWLPAMETQVDGLKSKRVYDEIKIKPEMEVIPGKWVFDEKEPQPKRFTARARWVACGNFERENWALQEVYAAVANGVSLRTFCAFVATQDLESYQYDFKLAYLNADIPKEHVYYVQRPTGLGLDTSIVWKLNKALYGLRRSALYWFQTLVPVMKELGFEPFGVDTCLFSNSKLGILLLLYVDDMLAAGPTKAAIDSVMTKLSNKFEMKSMGEMKRFLGFDIVRDRKRRTLFLSQEAYTTSIITKFGYQGLNPAKTPWISKFELPKQWEPNKAAQSQYLKKTGSLNYLSNGTRPDITYTASRLCEANSGPSQAHEDLMKHLFRYLIGAASLGLLFGGKLDPRDLGMRTFADASFADDLLTRFSTGAHVVFVAGGAILWKSKKQTFVASSTTEAEFANLLPAAQSALWVAKILEEAGAPQPKPTILYTDSLNAQTVALNPNNSARTRNLDIRYKWVVDRIAKGHIDLQHMPGDKMVADGLTKPLVLDKHVKFVKMLGMAAMKVPWLGKG
jgi:hypothetical protein